MRCAQAVSLQRSAFGATDVFEEDLTAGSNEFVWAACRGELRSPEPIANRFAGCQPAPHEIVAACKEYGGRVTRCVLCAAWRRTEHHMAQDFGRRPLAIGAR